MKAVVEKSQSLISELSLFTAPSHAAAGGTSRGKEQMMEAVISLASVELLGFLVPHHVSFGLRLNK